ncbi:aldehyde oxidase GLOX-like [Solanum dulcamara]|uniref:aldehyde oxidase GLOX-like n=1 Tax=Solanum dulcamara TaxID=45834 RepID=UPI0024856C04|nr:aldehyde oxidase GLOX-like [Solanum dulcamara]
MGLIKIQSFSFLFTILILSPSSSLSHHHRRHHHRRRNSQLIPSIFHPPFLPSNINGEWVLLHASIGVSAMHMQLLYNNKVIIFDRTDFGASNLSLPQGKCRYDDEVLDVDCSAHSILYDISSNTYRPLMIQTDVWCSSGALNSDGTLIQTGGYHAGDHKIRLFSPCEGECDWTELPQNLTVQRWYASDHILPDGRVIIVGGRKAFSYEFFPKTLNDNGGVFDLPFLVETTDPMEENNLYPFIYILPDGNLYIFSNQRSIVLDYVNHRVVKEFPMIPGEKRSYPATGSSVMLPLRLHPAQEPVVEVMICGGAWGGAYVKALEGEFWRASSSCGRMRLTDPDPKWVMEEMPSGRVMPDMLLLPTGDVIILNGAANGAAGWENAIDPILNPVLYRPDEPDPVKRFTVLTPSTIPRMYHSSATLLPDGRILVGGSNPHATYNFTGVRYPTELSLEAFSPPYLATEYAHLRPLIQAVEAGQVLSYGQQFSITFTLPFSQADAEFIVSMIAPSFTTHSFGMNQRLLVLHILGIERLYMFSYKVTVLAPPTRNIAPPGYYMVFVVHQGVPGHCVWVKIQ